jgi:hypothetical protein
MERHTLGAPTFKSARPFYAAQPPLFFLEEQGGYRRNTAEPT